MSISIQKSSAIQARRTVAIRLGGPVAFSLLTVAVLLVTAVPYFLAYRAAPAGFQFMGILLDVPDTAQYFSWARESASSFLIENKLTPEHGNAVYFNVFWLAIGHLAAVLRVGYGEAAQLVRPITGAIYLASIYWFTGQVLRDPRQRWTAALVAILGGGLGWLLVLQKQLTGAVDLAFPLDVYVIEGNTFLSLLAFPLQAMAGGLLVFILGTSALALHRSSFRLALVAGLLALALGLQHGYDLVIVYTVVGTVSLLLAARARSLRPLLLAGCICAWSVPATLWSLAITRFDPIWRGTLSQYGNAGVYTPPPAHLLILMGLPLLITLVSLGAMALGASPKRLVAWLRTAPALELLLWAWLLFGSALLYIPTDFQIKMLVGWQVPLAIFSTRALFSAVTLAAGRFPILRARRVGLLLASLLIVATLPTTVYLVSWRVLDLNRHDYPYYLRTDEVAALRWLDTNSTRSDVVLSSLTIGQYVPSLTGDNAFLAHWAMTLDYYGKQRAVALFFDAATADGYRQTLLSQSGVSYVFFGDPERQLGSYDPSRAPFLKQVYSNATVSVYRVQPALAASDAARQ